MAGAGEGFRAKVTPHKTAERYRRAKALSLRKAGMAYQAIAETPCCLACGHDPHDTVGCGFDPCECKTPKPGRLYSQKTAALRAVATAFDEIVTQPADDALKLELVRLDDLQLGSWERALRGDPAAYRNVLRTMERRAKLLGLDDFERRMIELEEAHARADERVVDQLQEVVSAVLARLDLPPDAQYRAPQVLAEEITRLGYGEGSENTRKENN